ncbi:hypothetical protein [Calothrix sp. PCC 6303]|uniref:choice-of-anchor Y domain-containing protein n=1 Tax=Calothrix sp. PCC 6303 TaxID=1170562 RepID=UPI0002A05238|nr:hypothetical protein [Calothrix sp. PCC 6303]AFZ01891.1 putative Ig [Calothrix sp. PCC 6303]
MKTPLAAVTTGLGLLIGVNSAAAVTLYNGLSFPSQQGWTYLRTTFGSAPVEKRIVGSTILDSGSNNNYAGYFRKSTVTLNRSFGYTITFKLQVNSETHILNDRAGLSMIVMSNQLPGESRPYGIELGFWENSIWSQNVGFTRGENVNFDTKTRVQTYKLFVNNKGYKLFVDGNMKNPILQGNLRQYTRFTPPPGYPNPYGTPNLIFLGDNTTSARAKFTVMNVDAQ